MTITSPSLGLSPIATKAETEVVGLRVDELEHMLSSNPTGGVFVSRSGFEQGDLQRAASRRNYLFFLIPGSQVTTKQEFLTTLAKSMQFPSYFGQNWDAAYDCITDLGWCPADGFIVHFDGADSLALSSPEDFAAAIEIFSDATEFWRTRQAPMYVLVSGPIPETPGLPVA